MKGIYDSNSTNVFECVNCGLQFLHPRMSTAEEQQYYNDYYKSQSDRCYKENSLPTIQNESYNFYQQYKDIFRKIINPKNNAKKTEKVLDIGSGTGGFVKFCREEFPEKKITAVDRDAENIDFLKNCFPDIDVRSSVPLSEIKYDLIFGHGILEHVRDSVKFVQYLKSHINEKGSIVLIVPNKYHALVYKYGDKTFKKFAYMKQHYFTFSEKSILFLAKSTGMKLTGFQYINRYGLGNHLSWLCHGGPRDYSDMEECISKATMESYNSDLCANKISDLMMITLKK